MSKFLTTHWGTYEVVEGKNSNILAMKLEKKFKQRKM